MKIIDLLNKIANGEEVPKKISYRNIIFYFNKENKTYYIENTTVELFHTEKLTERLNDEVEIMEEINKIPGKLCNREEYITQNDCIDEIIKKFNNLLDYLKSKGDE